MEDAGGLAAASGFNSSALERPSGASEGQNKFCTVAAVGWITSPQNAYVQVLSPSSSARD